MRRYGDSQYFANGSKLYERGGASLVNLFVQNLDGVARTLNVYALLWQPWAYYSIVSTDNPSYLFQSSSRPLGTVLGAAEYVAQHSNLGYGVQGYTPNNTVSWGTPGAYTHDVATWSVECTFRTSSDVTTQQSLFVTVGDGAYTQFIQIYFSGGVLHVAAPAVAIAGPTIAANTTYHLVVTSDGTTVRWYLNNILTTGTGTAPPGAQAIGTAPALYVGTAIFPQQPMLGSMGSLFAWRGVALTAGQIANHNQMFAYASFYQPLFSTTVGANAAYSTMIGRGGTYALPNVLLIAFTGEGLITIGMDE